jgi:hypothetical protein
MVRATHIAISVLPENKRIIATGRFAVPIGPDLGKLADHW